MPVSQPLIRTLLLYFAAIFLVTACSSGSKESSDNVFGDPTIHGSGPDAGGNTFDVAAPEVNILFPPASALTGADSIVVTGTATDATTITSITVNGASATSSDGFLTWRANVPLSSGTNTLDVITTDALGNRDPGAASTVVINNATFATPQSIALDQTNNRLVLVDNSLGAVFTVDLGSDQRTIVSNDDIGQGPFLALPFGVAVDEINNRAYVVDVGPVPALIAVDLATGDRTIISNSSNGGGVDFDSPDTISLDLDNGRALVTDLGSDSIIAVDLTSGARTLFAQIGLANDGNFPLAITVDTANANNRALVTVVESGDSSVVAFDLTTLASSVVSGPGSGGITLVSPGGITVDSTNGDIIVSDSTLQALVRIDPNTGNRTILSPTSVGDGDDFVTPLALVADGAADRSFVVDTSLSTIFEVNNSTGNRSALSAASIGTGPEFVAPFSIDIDPATNEALVTNNDSVYGVSLDTGTRRIISDTGVGNGNPLIFPSSIALQTPGRSAIVLDASAPAVVSIDLSNGDRITISDPGNGGGDDFVSPLGAALDTANNRLLVPNPDPGGDNDFLLDVDLATGNRSVLSRGDVTSPVAAPAIGSGPAFNFPQNIAVDSANQIGYVADTTLDALIAVDLSTGNRSTGPAGGASFPNVTNRTSLPPGTVPFQDVALTPSEAVVTDGDAAGVYGFDTTTGARRVISDSGNGPQLQGPVSIAVDPATGTLFVVDGALGAVVAIEPVSGDRVIVSR